MSMTAERSAKAIPTPAEVIASARALVPYLREQAERCETERRVSDETIRRLIAAGLFDVVKPRRYGGYEMGWDVFAEVVVTIASGCGSTGWVYSVVGGHTPVSARFGTDMMDDIWGVNRDALVASVRPRTGEAVAVAGGYRASILGPYSSGCLNADWLLVNDLPLAGSDRKLVVALPMSEVEVLDTWKVVGMAGTGSHDVRFKDVFIPEHRAWYPGKPPAGEMLKGPLFRTPDRGGALGGPLALPSVVLGIAIGGLEQFIEMTLKRSAGPRGKTPAELESMQIRVGEAAVTIDAALALLRAKLQETMAKLAGEVIEPRWEHLVLPPGGSSAGYYHAVSGYVGHAAYAALDQLMTAAGAGQLVLSAPFQRCFRDALAGTQQPSVSWDNGRILGGHDLLQRVKDALQPKQPS